MWRESKWNKPRNLCLLLATSLILSDCAPAPSPGCPVPIHATPAVKGWFHQHNPSRDVLDYLNLIGQQQKAIERECGK